MILTEEYRHYRNAILFSLILAALVALFILVQGKENSFMVINKFNNPELDYVFQYWTYLGEGVIWIPLIVYSFAFRKEFLIGILTAGIVCLLLTQGLKQVVFFDSMRPIVVLGEKNIHIIEGLHINTKHSFPSGHTSTAFTLALLMAYVVRGNFWVYFFPLVAFFVGYSRVYLAQHFVTDVFAGMMVGIISSYIGLWAYERVRRRKEKMEAEIIEQKKEVE